MAFFRAIAADLDLPLSQMDALKGAIDRKDEESLREFLGDQQVSCRYAEVLSELPHLCGGEEALERAADLAPNADTRRAIGNLKRICSLLSAQGLAKHVVIDLGEVRGMSYYTGIAFKGFSPGLGFPVCSGGRYDELIGLYGRPMPAVDFALEAERVLLALEGQRGRKVDLTPHLLVAAEAALAGKETLRRLRLHGLKIEVDVMARDEAGLLEYARMRGIPRVITAGDEKGALLVTGDERRRLSWDALEEVLLRC